MNSRIFTPNAPEPRAREPAAIKKAVLKLSRLIEQNHVAPNLCYHPKKCSRRFDSSCKPIKPFNHIFDIDSQHPGSLTPLQSYELRVLLGHTLEAILNPARSDLAQKNPQQQGRFFKSDCYHNVGISDEQRIDWNRLKSRHELLRKVIGNKRASVDLQLLLEADQASAELIELIRLSTTALIEDSSGCHVLRRAILNSEELAAETAKLADRHLLRWAGKDHSSRVVQTLVTINSEVRSKCLRTLASHWSFTIQNISAIFLISVSLRFSANTDESFLLVGHALLNRKALLLNCKNHKRVAVSYLEYCREEELKDFFEVLSFDRFFVKRMDDKYMVYIFSVFLTRNMKTAIRTLQKHLIFDIGDLLDTKHFKYLLYRIFYNVRLISLRETVADCLQIIIQCMSPAEKGILYYENQRVIGPISLENFSYLAKLSLAPNLSIDSAKLLRIIRIVSSAGQPTRYLQGCADATTSAL